MEKKKQDENESVAKPFVDQQGDKMDYHVATDIAQSANTAFMQKYGLFWSLIL